MSQRKEKYLRRTLKRCEEVAGDVEQLKNRVPTLERGLAGLKRRVDRRTHASERAAKRGDMVAGLSLITSAIALVVVVLMTLH